MTEQTLEAITNEKEQRVDSVPKTIGYSSIIGQLSPTLASKLVEAAVLQPRNNPGSEIKGVTNFTNWITAARNFAITMSEFYPPDTIYALTDAVKSDVLSVDEFEQLVNKAEPVKQGYDLIVKWAYQILADKYRAIAKKDIGDDNKLKAVLGKLEEIAYKTNDHGLALSLAQMQDDGSSESLPITVLLGDLKSKNKELGELYKIAANKEPTREKILVQEIASEKNAIYTLAGQILFNHGYYKAAAVAYANSNNALGILAVLKHYVLEQDTKTVLDLASHYKTIIKADEQATTLFSSLTSRLKTEHDDFATCLLAAVHGLPQAQPIKSGATATGTYAPNASYTLNLSPATIEDIRALKAAVHAEAGKRL